MGSHMKMWRRLRLDGISQREFAVARKKEQAFGESIEWFEFAVKYPDSEVTPGQDESATNEGQGKAPFEISEGSLKRQHLFGSSAKWLRPKLLNPQLERRMPRVAAFLSSEERERMSVGSPHLSTPQHQTALLDRRSCASRWMVGTTFAASSERGRIHQTSCGTWVPRRFW